MHFNDPLENPPKTDWVRLWDCGVTWKNIHIAPGKYDFSRLDYLVNLYSDRKILYVFAATPQWLATNPSELHYAPWLGPGSNSLPFDITEWSRFVSEVSLRYRGRIHAYEIWNEPQLVDFLSPYSTKNINRLTLMTKVAYSLIKNIDNKATILSASVLPRKSSGGMRRANKYLRSLKARGWPADIIACHIYPEVGTGPEKFAYYLSDVQNSVNKLGGPKKIWVTETNYNLLGPVIDHSQAWNYVKDTYKYSGDVPIFWYTWNKMNVLGGLNINHGTTAFTSMIKYSK